MATRAAEEEDAAAGQLGPDFQYAAALALPSLMVVLNNKLENDTKLGESSSSTKTRWCTDVRAAVSEHSPTALAPPARAACSRRAAPTR